MNINAAKIFARMKTAWVDRGNQGIAGEILANEVDRLEAKLTEAQAKLAKADEVIAAVRDWRKDEFYGRYVLIDALAALDKKGE